MASIKAANGFAVRPEAGQALRGRLRTHIANLELLERAVHQIGIQDWNGPMVDRFVHEAESTCLACPHTSECRRWLDDVVRPDAYRRFCPNVALFDLLSHSAFASSPPPSDQASSRVGRLARSTAAALTRWRHGPPPAADGRNDGAYYPHIDDLRRMRIETNRREVRALLDMAP